MKPPKNLVALMAEKTDDQLLEMFQKSDAWLREALDAAENELKQRGVGSEAIQKATSKKFGAAVDKDGLFVKADEIARESESFPQPANPSPPKKPSVLAIISLVFACSWIATPFVKFFIFGPVGGIVFGLLALWQIHRNRELGGRTMAMWGLGMGCTYFVVIILLGILISKMFRGLH